MFEGIISSRASFNEFPANSTAGISFPNLSPLTIITPTDTYAITPQYNDLVSSGNPVYDVHAANIKGGKE
ncbi:hypothetical protein J6590_049705 [Homalodisca vitripennis]|nr:hypothetical protein J6590_049705 [Homalodisca vitripennis]